MPKLYFRYGTMNSSKTANLLMVAWNYRLQCRKVLLVKPIFEDRFGVNVIRSRAMSSGVEADLIIDKNWSEIENVKTDGLACVLVDEAQFLSEKNVDSLRELAKKVPVICYGLRTDYRTKLFEGSKRLLEVADVIEEIKNVCINCDKKAIINAKFYKKEDGDRVIIRYGSNELDIGAEEKYQPMCWNCFSK
jgi:thymidine kinase